MVVRGVLRVSICAVLLCVVFAGLVAPPMAAAPIGDPAFQRTWARTDQPVMERRVSRTWMWGPEAGVEPIYEPYAESSGGQRLVQYFDKSRMEITHPGGDSGSLWYVTNGLLTREMITGQRQLGDSTFELHQPAQVNVSGDPDDPNAPTYATFKPFIDTQPLPEGTLIIQTVNRAGEIGIDWSLARFGVTADALAEPTHHRVASVFWSFMNSTGLTLQGDQVVNAPLFENPYYATGYPLSEPYWTTVKVGGVPKQVLIQIFERRVLTYTPENPDGWRVEAGNVGQHYYSWRYGYHGFQPPSAYPIWIRGLTPDAAIRYIQARGDSCTAPHFFDRRVDFECEVQSQDVSYGVAVTLTDDKTNVRGIEVYLANYGAGSTSQVATTVLGYIARIPYADAESNSASTQVARYIGEHTTFEVGSATFILNINATPGSGGWSWQRSLWIVATGDVPEWGLAR